MIPIVKYLSLWIWPSFYFSVQIVFGNKMLATLFNPTTHFKCCIFCCSPQLQRFPARIVSEKAEGSCGKKKKKKEPWKNKISDEVLEFTPMEGSNIYAKR